MFRISVRRISTVLLALTLSGVAFSQGSTGRRIADPNYIVTRTVSETIVSINLKNNEVLLRDWDGKNHTVKVNTSTKFFTPQQTASLRDLKAGQTIRILYRVADSTALEIRVLPPNPKK